MSPWQRRGSHSHRIRRLPGEAAGDALAPAAALFGGDLGGGLHDLAGELGAPRALKDLGLAESDLVLLDLLEIAAYVYCADQQSSRGSEKLTEHGRDWRRAMNFTIPVRQPSLWASASVTDALCETLGFLSDEAYERNQLRASTADDGARVQPSLVGAA